MITFTPLSGAVGESQTCPLAYLLQLDDVRVLLDCGSPDWSPEERAFKPDNDPASCAPTVDLVLLSHGDLAHSGLYAYAYARWGLKAPAYSTIPVQAMARIATLEDVEGLRDEQDIDDSDQHHAEPSEHLNLAETQSALDKDPTPSSFWQVMWRPVQEVHEAYDSVNTLRYSQPTHLQGKCQGITIIPFSAGHSLGGTIWKIRSPSVGTIVYAVNMNHMKERHLDGTPLARPDLFITDADRANVTTPRRKDRDAALIDTISATLSSRSSLLLPCDAGPHMPTSAIPICLLSRNGREMLTFVRSMMEWVGGTVSKEDVGVDSSGKTGAKRRRGDDDAEDEAVRGICLTIQQSLMHTYSSKEPKIILAVPASLSHADFAAVPDNVVLLTGRGEEGTLARLLDTDKWDKGKIGSNVMMDGVLQLKMNSKVPLQGAELEAYLAKERAAKEKEAAHQAAIVRNQRVLEADEDESDEESDSDSEEEEVERALDDDDDEMDDFRTIAKHDKTEDNADWGGDMDDGLTKTLLSFDIYLKGNCRWPNSPFPYVPSTTGETIDVGMWLRKGKETEEVKEAKRKQAEEEDKNAVREPPSKFVSSEIEIQLACRLLFARTLIESCGQIRSMTRDIYAPSMGESIQIGQHTNTLKMSRFEDNEVGYVTGRVTNHFSLNIPILEPAGSSVSAEAANARVIVPSDRIFGARVTQPLPRSTMIGELKLTALKARLASIGVPAELIGEGVLVCGAGARRDQTSNNIDETVAVRKTGRGKVELEGNVSDVYYIVRREIYGLHALIAA
ncbi:beta-lactamase-like protein [Pisolithus croceorrhizus]|nr:beta-lactamase-like protein [Pisolithus croceorrhizus]